MLLERTAKTWLIIIHIIVFIITTTTITTITTTITIIIIVNPAGQWTCPKEVEAAFWFQQKVRGGELKWRKWLRSTF